MPDNGQAVVGFVFSIVAVGLLVISFGLSSIVSVGCSITGIVCSRNGKRKVDAGRDAQAQGPRPGGLHRRLGRARALDPGDRRLDPRDRVRRHRRVERRHARAPPERGGGCGRRLTLFSPVRGESLRQAVPHDRRAHAAASGGVAGDGGADDVPPGARLHRGLRARAPAPEGRLPDRERGPGLHQLRHRRARVGRRQPGQARRARPRGVLRQVRRALVRAVRGVRRRDDPLGDRVGPQDRPGRARRAARRQPGRRARLHHLLGDVDRRRQRPPRAHRGGAPPRRADRRRRRVRPRRRAASPGRVGGRRGRGRLAEGADVAARPRLRQRERARARARRRGTPAAASTSTGRARSPASARTRRTARSRPPSA